MTFDYEKYSPHHGWHESVFEMATEAGAIIGIDVDKIYYSGFWSQGDGASFVGGYRYAKGAAKRIRAEFPSAAELHNIADTLQAIQRRAFYQLAASVTQSGRYVHEMTMSVDVDRRDGVDSDLRDASDTVTEAMRDFARWIYATLEKEYEYQAAWQLAAGWQDLASDAATERQAARSLIHDIRDAMRSGIAAAPSICIALRASVRSHLERMAEAKAERAEIESVFSYWDDGKSVGVAEFAAANL